MTTSEAEQIDALERQIAASAAAIDCGGAYAAGAKTGHSLAAGLRAQMAAVEEAVKRLGESIVAAYGTPPSTGA